VIKLRAIFKEHYYEFLIPFLNSANGGGVVYFGKDSEPAVLHAPDGGSSRLAIEESMFAEAHALSELAYLEMFNVR
jgi:hypothetical protein